MRDTWQPSWAAENRAPAFMGGPPVTQFGKKKKYLWGNVPALDVLKLEQNEGLEFQGDLNLLFAGMLLPIWPYSIFD